MLQILIFAVCGVMIGLGYCGMMLARIESKDKPVPSNGAAIFLIMICLAVVIIIFSINQAQSM